MLRYTTHRQLLAKDPIRGFLSAGGELEENFPCFWFQGQLSDPVDDDQSVWAKPGQFFAEIRSKKFAEP